jgi:integrase
VTMTRNEVTGNFEADLKDRMAGRLHLSLRTSVKREATARYAALLALVREGDLDLINRLRAQKIHISAVERCVRDRVPFATLRASGARWPTVREAIEQYIAWLEANENKADWTAVTAKSQLAAFSGFDGIGALRLDDVTPEQIAAYQTWLATDGNAGKPYAVNTRTAYVGRVATLYAFMQEEEHRKAIRENRQPRTLHSPVDTRTQPRGHTHRERYLTPEEAEALFAATPDQLRFPVAAGLLGGLRVSEVLHLRPPPLDVDLSASTLAIQPKEWGSASSWQPKTKGSHRRVNMNDELREMLEHHVARYASLLWIVPSLADPTHPMVLQTFTEMFTRVVKAADLWAPRGSAQAVTFHTLRHTFASWLVMADENVLTVAKLLGNSVGMVEQVYGHLAPEHRKKAVGRLSGLIAIPPTIAASTNGGHP